jgi:hypothetical protein
MITVLFILLVGTTVFGYIFGSISALASGGSYSLASRNRAKLKELKAYLV